MKFLVLHLSDLHIKDRNSVKVPDTIRLVSTCRIEISQREQKSSES
jgi:hypothetical protein